MLEGGVDIRYIQQMPGPADPSTTEIYTHVAIRKLQQIHTATHPGTKLEKKNNCRHPRRSRRCAESRTAGRAQSRRRIRVSCNTQ
jgi:hypothetical protein